MRSQKKPARVFILHDELCGVKWKCMGDLHKAIGDISSIRRQIAGSTQFRGYGPATLAATGLFALAAAALQSVRVPDSSGHIGAYLTIWISTAALSAALTGTQMYTRTRRMHSGLSNEMLGMAVEQFLPAVGAGLLVTVVLVQAVPAAIWMLPGLWQIIFSLGIFSSCRFLPRTVIVAASWYLLSGLLCISLGDIRALAPWTMGLGFGVGQLLSAAMLFIGTPKETNES